MLTSSFLPVVGGMEWKVHYLASEYTRAGHDVVVFALRPGLRKRHLKLPIAYSYEVVRTGLTIRGFGRLGINLWLWQRSIMRQHSRRKFDVLHCHPLGLSSYCGSRLRIRAGIPCVVTTSGGDIQVHPSMSYGDRLIPRVDRMIRESLKNADVVGCISDAIRDTIEEIGTTAWLAEIPNGVAWQDFQVPRGDFLRQRLEIPKGHLIILSVGRNSPVKDHPTSIKAFARIRAKFPNSVLAIVGRGVSDLQGEVEGAGVRDCVYLVEQVPISDIPGIMRSADIFLNSSLMEGFAQVNAQALASGLPCVITDSPGNIDAAKNGGVLLAKTGNPESIAAALGRLLDDPQERTSLGKAAHEAGKLYDWRNIAGQYLNIFEELVDQKSDTLIQTG